MFSGKSRLLFVTTFGLFLILGLLGGEPLYAQTVFVSAGGPYEADVGEEIEFDASGSAMSDGSPIDGYYWDWDGDGEWDECFSLPEAKHTWHSAFSGTVRLFIFYPGGVDWADARVTVKGPETAIAITLGASATLHLRADGGKTIGMDDDTGLFDMDIAGATLTLVPPTNGSADDSLDLWSTLVTVPLTNNDSFVLTLTGAAAGPFEVRLQGIQDGKVVSDEFLVGQIAVEEEIQVDVVASVSDGNLTVKAGPLRYSPEMKVDPDDKIELNVQPGGRYETTITISETEGLRPLLGVALTCTELTGNVYTIPVSDISFSENGFNVAAGSKQDVVMAIEIPEFFLGQVTGTLTVSCAAADQSEEIDVVVRKAGTHAPIIEVESPVYGVVNAAVEFDATGSVDIDGEIDKYCWDWNLSGKYECVDGPVISHTWDATFTGVVRLRVVDDEGNATERYVQVVITE